MDIHYLLYFSIVVIWQRVKYKKEVKVDEIVDISMKV
jgi:hypothetical protein